MIPFLNFLNTRSKAQNLIKVDIHSHLLPGLDDGTSTIEESVQIIKEFSTLGYQKIITTPHIIDDYYPNNVVSINLGLQNLREKVKKENISIEIEAGAEYFVDENFLNKIQREKLITFGGNYVLFETSFINKPHNLEAVVFELLAAGYKPVFAHPERYLYLIDKFSYLQELKDKGLLLQINLMSLTGYYSRSCKDLAERLIDMGMVDFAGSDCHHIKHIEVLKKAYSQNYFNKLNKLGILNNQML